MNRKQDKKSKPNGASHRLDVGPDEEFGCSRVLRTLTVAREAIEDQLSHQKLFRLDHDAMSLAMKDYYDDNETIINGHIS
jgi:hypothetical protein